MRQVAYNWLMYGDHQLDAAAAAICSEGHSLTADCLASLTMCKSCDQAPCRAVQEGATTTAY